MTGVPDFQAMLARGARIGPSPWGGPRSPVAISFGGGLPDPAHLPIEELTAAAERVLRRDGAAALSYGGPYGFEGLRDFLIDVLKRDDGRTLERESVILTNGSSQGVALACAAFVDPDDAVVIEAPTFVGSLRAILSYGADVMPVPLDDDGMQVEVLEERLAQRRPKLVYTITNFNNPSSVSLSQERRERLMELARTHEFIILEDDAYGALRYEGRRLPSLFSMDDRGLVIKLGTFSKILATGLRVGWAAGHPDAIAAMASMRNDMGISPLLTRTVAELAQAGTLERHVDRMVDLYRLKRDRMLAALGEYCGPLARWRRPEGGFFVWLELAQGADPARLVEAATEEGVGYVPGGAFFDDPAMGLSNVRLAFSHVPSEEIEKGVAAFARALSAAHLPGVTQPP